jgi:hypothetical protein
MSNVFTTKGIFLNNRTSLPKFGVDPITTLADLLVAGGFKTVYYHITSGTGEYTVQTNWWLPAIFGYKYQPNARLDIIQAIQARGIAVIGWGMCYGGVNSTADGKLAAQMVMKYNLDGWAFDIEQGFDTGIYAVTNAAELVTSFKKLSSVPVGWCSWPTYYHAHPVAVARMGTSLCDVGISMAYSMRLNVKEQAAEGVRLAEQSVKEWREFTDKPLVLAGRAFKENGYTTNADAIVAFDNSARVNGAAGSAWWFLDHAQPATQPTWWEALRLLPQYGVV